MNSEHIAHALGLRRVGREWRGPCLLRGGSSFTLTEKEGKILFTCWSGCDRGAILAELKARGLWPESSLTRAEKRDFAKQRARDEADLQSARLFADAAHILAEQALENLEPCDPQRGPLTRLLAALRSDAGMLHEYRAWRSAHLEMTRALVAAGANHIHRLSGALQFNLLREGDTKYAA